MYIRHIRMLAIDALWHGYRLLPQIILWFLLIGCLILVAGLAPNAPLAFVAMSMIALLYRVGRRVLLHRFGYREVSNRWCDPDPLGPWIDEHILHEPVTGKTIRLDTHGRDVTSQEVSHG